MTNINHHHSFINFVTPHSSYYLHKKHNAYFDYRNITYDKSSEGEIQMLEKDQLPATRVILQYVETANFSDGRSESFF